MNLEVMKKERPFNEDYPYMVIPYDEIEQAKARADGLTSSFHRTKESAEECKKRLDLHSGVKWRVKNTGNERPDWFIVKEIYNLAETKYKEKYGNQTSD